MLVCSYTHIYIPARVLISKIDPGGELFLENMHLTLGVLRLLAEAVEHHPDLCVPLANGIRVIRMDGNAALGAQDGRHL